MNLSHEKFLDILALLKLTDSVAADQRIQPRVPMRASVMVAAFPDGKIVDQNCVDPSGNDAQLGQAYSVRVVDLSSGGVAFNHFHALPKGKPFLLDLPAKNANPDSGVRLLCRVQHCRMTAENRFQIGAQFVRIWNAPAPVLDAAQRAA